VLANALIGYLLEFERVLNCNDQSVVVHFVWPLRSQDTEILLRVATVRYRAGKAEIGNVESDKFR